MVHDKNLGSSKRSGGGDGKAKSRGSRSRLAFSVSQPRARAPTTSPVRSSSGRCISRPTIKMKTHDTPVQPSSDSDDELLLTSRGWNYSFTNLD